MKFLQISKPANNVEGLIVDNQSKKQTSKIVAEPDADLRAAAALVLERDEKRKERMEKRRQRQARQREGRLKAAAKR